MTYIASVWGCQGCCNLDTNDEQRTPLASESITSSLLYPCPNSSGLGICHETSELRTSLHKTDGFCQTEEYRNDYYFKVFEARWVFYFDFFSLFDH